MSREGGAEPGLIRLGPVRSSDPRFTRRWHLCLFFAGTAGLTATWWFAGRPHPLWLVIGLAVLLPWISVMDLASRRIPNLLTYLCAVLALLAAGLEGGWPDRLAGGLWAGGLLALLAWAGSRSAGRQVMGMGDVKLATVLGTLAGLTGSIWMLMIAATGALAFGLVGTAISRQRPGVIAFGPWIALGFWWVWLFGTPMGSA